MVDPKRLEHFKQLLAQQPNLFVKPKLTKYIPHRPFPKQHAAMLLGHVKEVFYGGAGGGGKSDWLLMEALQYVDTPGYHALLLRKTYGQLNMPNSILHRAHEWLRGTDAKWLAKDSRYIFPSGAILQFGYCQHNKDVYNYDGPEYHFIGWDELTNFTEFQYTHLFARLRKLAASIIPTRVRSASNPGNIGHQWVKQRMILDQGPERVFIPAYLTDNPHLDQADYEKSLQELDPVTRAQRKDGDWDIVAEGAIFKPQWFTRYIDLTEVPTDCRWTRFWDFAGTVGGGDATAGAKLGRSKSSGDFYLADMKKARIDPAAAENLVLSTAILDKTKTRVRWEQEPGSAGKALTTRLTKLLAGYDCMGLPVTKSKVVRWRPLAAQASSGNLVIVNAHWNHELIAELCAADGSEKMHDDQVDAVAGAFTDLTVNQPVYVGVSRI